MDETTKLILFMNNLLPYLSNKLAERHKENPLTSFKEALSVARSKEQPIASISTHKTGMMTMHSSPIDNGTSTLRHNMESNCSQLEKIVMEACKEVIGQYSVPANHVQQSQWKSHHNIHQNRKKHEYTDANGFKWSNGEPVCSNCQQVGHRKRWCSLLTKSTPKLIQKSAQKQKQQVQTNKVTMFSSTDAPANCMFMTPHSLFFYYRRSASSHPNEVRYSTMICVASLHKNEKSTSL